jgi:plastocyanin
MKNSVKKTWLASLLALAVVLALVGCSKKEEPTTNEAQSSNATETKAAATPIDKSTVGSVSGTVKFDGAKPKAAKIDMSQDPACAKKGENTVETYAGDGANLANVFVYVKDGLGNRTFDSPKDAAEINQEGCRYHPHVLGVMVNQPVKILNSDQTTHNIHPTPANNREWNESQPPGAQPIEKTFAREEIMLPVKCNQHPWMKMYVNVAKNPYFAVTDDKGNYTIKDLPPGDYTLAFVHEKTGETTQKVTIGAKEDKKGVDATLKAGGTAAGQ